MAKPQLTLLCLCLVLGTVTAMQTTSSGLSLTKSWFYFLLSIFQTLVLFTFFWQRREVTIPSRDLSATRPIYSHTTITTVNEGVVPSKPTTAVVPEATQNEDPDWNEEAFISRMADAGAKGIGKMIKKADAAVQKRKVVPVSPREQEKDRVISKEKEKTEDENTEEEKEQEESNSELKFQFSPQELLAGLSALSSKTEDNESGEESNGERSDNQVDEGSDNNNNNNNDEEVKQEQENPDSEQEQDNPDSEQEPDNPHSEQEPDNPDSEQEPDKEEEQQEQEEEGEEDEKSSELKSLQSQLDSFKLFETPNEQEESENDTEKHDPELDEEGEQATKENDEVSLNFGIQNTPQLLTRLDGFKKSRITRKYKTPSTLREMFVRHEEKSDSWTDDEDDQKNEKKNVDDTKDPKENGEKHDVEEDDVQSDENDDGDDDDDNEGNDDNTAQLVKGYGVHHDMNKQGLIRGKKGVTVKGNKKVYQMEDTHLAMYPFQEKNNMGLFCVFDGHAGLGCSSTLVDLFPRVFVDHWDKLKQSDREHMVQLWEGIYKEVDQGLEDFEYEGSTGTTLLVWRNANGRRCVQCANVGDSTAFICRNGKAVPLSQDHKPTHPAERNRLQAMGIHMEENQSRLNGLAVSRAFGDRFPKEIQCGIVVTPFVSKKFVINSGDSRIIIASDGLWDIVQPQQAFNVTKNLLDPKEAAAKLVKMAVSDQRCHDNVTVIVINLN